MNDKKELTIVQMNDTHGYIDEHFEYMWDGGEEVFQKMGGYPRLKEYVENVRKQPGNNVLFLDGGDTFHGTYHAVKSKGEKLIPLVNELGLDAMTAHWEFAYGPEHFVDLTKDLNHPMLAINCYNEKDDSLVFPPYTIKKINGVKIGVIGIAATIVDKVMPEKFSEGVYFTDGDEELPSYIKELKEEEDVDLIVLLSHLGFPQEIELAERVDGIDILLSAHTHNRVYEPAIINDTIIIQSGCHGSFLGRLDLTVEGKDIVDFKHQLVPMDESRVEDKQLRKKVDQVLEEDEEELGKVVGRTKTDLSRDKVLEATMDNFLLQSLMHHEKDAVLAFSNGWRYGAPIPKGEIRVNDLWNIIPVNPPVSTVELTGEELINMMEENLERTFSKEPFNQMGGYVKRSLGLNLYFKIENPYGQRIQELFVGDERVDRDKTYKAVYVTSQGVPKKYGKNRKHLDIHAIDALKNYLKDKGEIDASLRGTIIAI